MTEVLASRYEVLEIVGRGGQGLVLKAHDRRHQRLVAVKVLEASASASADELLAEAGVLLRVRPHAGLPIVRDDFFVDDRYAIVMDWIEGDDLSRIVAERGEPGLPLSTVVDVIAQVAAALDHLHAHDPPIIHGDVKPSNLVLRPDGSVVLVDFGVASVGASDRSGGTRGYIAPEIGAGGRPTAASDVYSLAATAVTLLTGRPPSSGDVAWHGFDPDDIGAVARTLRRALATDPDKRPASAGELAERLRAGHRSALPTGIVTFIGTDIADADTLWDTHADSMTEVCARLGDLICESVEGRGGRLVTSTGAEPTTLSVFQDASSAAAAASTLHQRVHDERWPKGLELGLKIALHTGEAEIRDGQYVGPDVHHVTRLRALSPPGTTIVSQTTADLIGHRAAGELGLVTAPASGAADGRDPVGELTDADATAPTRHGHGDHAPGVWLLAADIGEVAEVSQHSPEQHRERVGNFRADLADLSKRHAGTVVNTVDDTIVLAFPDAANALAAAYDAVDRPSADVPGLRLGLHFEARSDASWAIDTVTSAGARAMCLAAHPGQILVSSDGRDGVEAVLEPEASLSDLGTHRLTDLAQPQRVYQVVDPRRRGAFPPLRSLDSRPHNLPVQLTRFVGRHGDIEQLARLVLDHRLVTVTGTGGAGKTRLALQVAAQTLTEFPDGAWLADIAGVTDGDLLATAVSAAVGVQESGAGTFAAPGLRSARSATERLLDHFEQRSALLVLDGCEHLIESCRDLVSCLLQRCPGLRILATSRELLELPGEVTYRVGSLALPVPGDLPEDMRQSAAVCLFVDRAMLRRPDLVIDDDATAFVASICRQVDGIPLAIELAAARIKVLALPQLAAMLEDSLGLLADDNPSATPRHATVRSTIEWSYTTLSERERMLFRRLSVFAGGFTLEAAQQVCGRDGLERFEVLDLLGALVDKSFVETEIGEAAVRYRILDATRQYAAERCDELGEAEMTRAAHIAWATSVAEQAEIDLAGPEQARCLAALDAEDENLCAAMRTGDRDASYDDLRIAASLGQYWLVRGRLSEGRAWIDDSLDRARRVPEPLQAKALYMTGMLACFAGDYERTDEAAGHAIALSWGQAGRRWGARGLGLLGLSASGRGEFEAGERRQEEALAASRDIDDQWAIAFALNNLGNMLALRGASADARSCYEEALTIRSSTRDTWGIVWTQFRLGVLASWQGELEEAVERLDEARSCAEALRYGQGTLLALLGLADAHDLAADTARATRRYEEALDVARRLEEPTGACIALAGLAGLALARGDAGAADEALDAPEFEVDPTLATRVALLRGRSRLATHRGQRAQAAAWGREVLLLRRELGDARGVIEQLEELALAAGDTTRAATLLGAAAAARDRCGYPLPPRDRPPVERALAALTSAPAGAEAYRSGQVLPDSGVMDVALAR